MSNLTSFGMSNLGDYLSKNKEKVNAVKVGSFLVDIKHNNLTFELKDGVSIILIGETKSFTKKFTVRILKKGSIVKSMISVTPQEVMPFLKTYNLAEQFIYIIKNCSYFPQTVKKEFSTLV